MGIATVDVGERLRLTRVEVARLQALPYRVNLTDQQKAIAFLLIWRHAATLPFADQETIFAAEVKRVSPEVDWAILEEEWARDAINTAVYQVISHWGGEKLTATKEDLTQCAQIILAEQPEKYRRAKRPHVFLRQQLVKLVRFEHRDASLEALTAAQDASAEREEGDGSDSVWMPAPYVRNRR